MRLHTTLIGIALTLGASAGQAAECIRAGDEATIAEGSLAQWTFEDAAGRPEQAFILALPAPACMTGGEETDNVEGVKSLHVYSADPGIAARIKELLGEDVQIRGTPFGAHTAHHHAPIVIDVSEIDAL